MQHTTFQPKHLVPGIWYLNLCCEVKCRVFEFELASKNSKFIWAIAIEDEEVSFDEYLITTVTVLCTRYCGVLDKYESMLMGKQETARITSGSGGRGQQSVLV